ncbi:MAG: hypothetical protein JO353_11685, partial [Phycisphaerae bacterium]|nr:hypothetical protein [Phycisphaerae bacterium]
MRFLIACGLVVALSCNAKAALWQAEPIFVHEWGVEEFDWGKNSKIAAPLPSFVYTAQAPGIAVSPSGPRTKDLEADSGFRAKPLLLFHADELRRRPTTIPVGVEVRFAQGHASAWWPQINVYRTPSQVDAAAPLDWHGWKSHNRGNGFGPMKRPVPDDQRFDLVWYNLILSPGSSTTQPMEGDSLPDRHWVKQARNVDSALISNGKEHEKFLFYEGATHEFPSIAICDNLRRMQGPVTCSVVNIGGR